MNTDISQLETILPHQVLPQFNLPLCVVRYINDVKARYVQQSILPDSGWPPSLGGQYIRLALIHQERQLRNYTYESVVEQQKDYTRGDYDKIMEYKTKIELIKAFEEMVCEGGNKIVLKMLIDGAPGVGKTTLSRKVSNMWANGEILQRYWLVLLLHLREKAISKAKTIDKFFYHHDRNLQQHIIKFVKERSGDGVMIIFDGFDELSFFERSEKSLFLDICRGEVLPKCAVVVTSRPYASRSLQELQVINRHIEVLGFTEQQVKECIMHKITDAQKAEELCVELKDRLDIASICQIPLNCSIVLYVYEQENYHLPHTLTELYELFILHSLKRFLRRTHDERAANKLLWLDGLSSPFKEYFKSLCKLAFNGLMEDKLVFSQQEVEAAFDLEYLDSDVDLSVLDLMTSAKSYSSRGAQNIHNFLHLTIQEFLAAFWIARCMSDDEQLHFFRQTLMENRFRMVILFLSGLTKLKIPGVTSVFGPVYWKNNRIYVCHLAYESENYSLCKDIAAKCCESDTHRSIKLCEPDLTAVTNYPFRYARRQTQRPTKSYSRFDTLVVSNFIACSGYHWKELVISPDDVRTVHKVFSSERLNSNTFIETVSLCILFEGHLKSLSLLNTLPQVGQVSVNFKYDFNLFLKLAECLVYHSSIREVVINAICHHTDLQQIFDWFTINRIRHVESLRCTIDHRLMTECSNTLKKRLTLQYYDLLHQFIVNNTSLIRNLSLTYHRHYMNIKDDKEVLLCDLISAFDQSENETLQKLTIFPERLHFERNSTTGVMELRQHSTTEHRSTESSHNIIPYDDHHRSSFMSLSSDGTTNLPHMSYPTFKQGESNIFLPTDQLQYTVPHALKSPDILSYSGAATISSQPSGSVQVHSSFAASQEHQPLPQSLHGQLVNPSSIPSQQQIREQGQRHTQSVEHPRSTEPSHACYDCHPSSFAPSGDGTMNIPHPDHAMSHPVSEPAEWDPFVQLQYSVQSPHLLPSSEVTCCQHSGSTQVHSIRGLSQEHQPAPMSLHGQPLVNQPQIPYCQQTRELSQTEPSHTTYGPQPSSSFSDDVSTHSGHYSHRPHPSYAHSSIPEPTGQSQHNSPLPWGQQSRPIYRDPSMRPPPGMPMGYPQHSTPQTLSYDQRQPSYPQHISPLPFGQQTRQIYHDPSVRPPHGMPMGYHQHSTPQQFSYDWRQPQQAPGSPHQMHPPGQPNHGWPNQFTTRPPQ